MTSQDNIMDFMLGGSGGRRRGGRGGGAAAVPNNTKSPSPSSSCSRSNNNKKNKKQQEQQEIVIKNARMAFIKTLVCDWLQTDDDLFAVVQSVYHLRQRIHAIISSRRCCQQQQATTNQDTTIIDHHNIMDDHQKPDNVNTTTNNSDGSSSSSSSWKQQGYRGRNNSTTAASSSLLRFDDWNIGLDHDLLQYERTLSILRKSISKLNQIQDALGRRYDEYSRLVLLKLQLLESSCEENDDNEQQPSPYVDDDDDSSKYGILLSINDCQALFTATSIELYRKQCLVEEILLLDESNHNNLLYKNANDDNDAVGVEDDKTTTKNPRTLARRCMEQWSRNYKTSPLQRFAELLDRLQNS